jgi:hypothetical protein
MLLHNPGDAAGMKTCAKNVIASEAKQSRLIN